MTVTSALYVALALAGYALAAGLFAGLRRRILGPSPDGGENPTAAALLLAPHVAILMVAMVVIAVAYALSVPAYLVYRLTAGPAGKPIAWFKEP